MTKNICRIVILYYIVDDLYDIFVIFILFYFI